MVAIVLLGVAVIALAWRSYSDTGPAAVPPPPSAADIPSIRAVDLRRTTLYHSPQTPGYTAWTGAWLMPDQSIMTAFIRATGPLDPSKRARAPANVVRSFGLKSWPAARDFWGLDTTIQYRLSTDGGQSWIDTRADHFRSLYPAPYIPQADIALDDGTIVRRVNGDDQRYDPAVPHTAYLQRLAPGAKDWGPPQVLLDPNSSTYQISRIRKLRDGRLIATGNVWDTPASTTPTARGKIASKYLLMVSSDGGKTWQNGLTQDASAGFLYGGEWDTGELPNGDLVALMRTHRSASDATPVLKEAVLHKQGAGWILSAARTAPFPQSGHPELLATQEGPVLSIAPTGVEYTKDGLVWHKLEFRPSDAYRSNYYPRAVQTDDGAIHVFSHVGHDDPYGSVDESITYDQFQLAETRAGR
jgi:hypothetical protein